MAVEDPKHKMIHHGLTDLFKLHPGVTLYGKKDIKITISLLDMLKPLIYLEEIQPKLKLLLELIQDTVMQL